MDTCLVKYNHYFSFIITIFPLYNTLHHRDNFPKHKEEYSNDDNNDSHKCDDSSCIGQQSVKCDCLLLDDEESDYTQNSSSEKHVEQHKTISYEEMMIEDNQGSGSKYFIMSIYVVVCHSAKKACIPKKEHNFHAYISLSVFHFQMELHTANALHLQSSA